MQNSEQCLEVHSKYYTKLSSESDHVQNTYNRIHWFGVSLMLIISYLI